MHVAQLFVIVLGLPLLHAQAVDRPIKHDFPRGSQNSDVDQATSLAVRDETGKLVGAAAAGATLGTIGTIAAGELTKKQRLKADYKKWGLTARELEIIKGIQSDEVKENPVDYFEELRRCMYLRVSGVSHDGIPLASYEGSNPEPTSTHCTALGTRA